MDRLELICPCAALLVEATAYTAASITCAVVCLDTLGCFEHIALEMYFRGMSLVRACLPPLLQLEKSLGHGWGSSMHLLWERQDLLLPCCLVGEQRLCHVKWQSTGGGLYNL